jgi:hypothetical protein
MAARKRDMKKESFWRRMVRGQPGSGLSVRGWCRKHRVREAGFYWWRRQLARRDTKRRPASFVRVRVAADEPDDGASRIEIVLAGGRRVHIHGRVDRQMLSEVLAVLEGQVC